MTKFPSLKCPICGKTYKEVGPFGNHMRNEHPGVIPEDWSDLRYAYFVHTGKSHGRCRECKGDTPWNETTGAYSRICTSEACRKQFRDRFMAGMRARYGKANLLDDPAYRERMLTGRKISGEYVFADGGKVGYMGTLEKAFLKMMDTFFRFPSSDIISPSPNRYNYYYENANDPDRTGIHAYVPDFWIPSCNLEIELKASNNQRPRNLMIDVVRDACKDVHMIRNPVVNYIKIYEDDYHVLFQVFADLARQNQTGEKKPIKYISRSLLTSIYRDYIPDDCMKIIDENIYKYSEKHVLKKNAATESDEGWMYLEGPEEEAMESDEEIRFDPSTVYHDAGNTVEDDFSEDDDDFDSDSIGVNPLAYYKMGEFAEMASTAANESEAVFECFSIDDNMDIAMEWWFIPNVDESKIDGRAAIQYGKWRDTLFTGFLGKSTAKIFSKVTIENGNIVVKGINANLLLYRIKEKYSEAKLKYIFQYKYNERSWKAYQKKKIGRGDMKIDYVYAPEFFCLELVELFRDLGTFYHDASYQRIAEMIYEASWLSKADQVMMPPLDLAPLNALALELLPHQKRFIELWPQLKNQLNINGYILAFKPGKGKTLTAVGLSECLKAKKVYIVCPNNLKDNWALEIKKYYHKYLNDETAWMRDVCILGTKYGDPSTARFIITNNENIKLMMPIAKNDPDSVVILDECHNFRNFNGGRSKELFALCDKIGSKNVLCVSATPIKASPAEITPVLRIIDPTFNDEAASMYTHCFDLSDTMAMGLVTKRFGKVIYRPADAEVDLPPKYLREYEVKVSDESRYYMDVVHDEIIADFNKRHNEWLKKSENATKDFRQSIYKYAICNRRHADEYIGWVLSSANSMKGGDDSRFHEISVKEFREFIDTYIRPNVNCPATEADRLTQMQNEFTTAAKRNMGKAVGSILPKRRSEMFIKMYEENKQEIYDMIRSCTKKTVIFSTMVPVVKYIAKDLIDFGIGTVSISGDTKDRLNTLNKFREDPNTLVLVATSWCMGVGVTLTEASQMFFFGPPWRSTDFEQASDRIWRIGQTVPVTIWTARLKSAKANLSDRMQDILEWSSRMFGTAITASDIDDTPDNSMIPANEMYGPEDMYAIIFALNDMLNRDYRVTKKLDPMRFRTQNPGIFGKSHIGTCFDFMAFSDLYVRSHGLLPEPYIVYIRNFDLYHAFILIEDGDRWIYPESCLGKVRGIFTARSIDEVVSFVVNELIAGKANVEPEVEVLRPQSFYGRFNESLVEFKDRIEKTSERIPYKYNRYVRHLSEIVPDVEALEAFNMRLDDDQYELLDEREMKILKKIVDVFNSIQYTHGPDIAAQVENPIYGGMSPGSSVHCTEWSTVCDLRKLLVNDFQTICIMLRVGNVYEDAVIEHPIIAVPFKDGALYLESAFDERRNGIYYVESIDELLSGCANWIAKKLNPNRCIADNQQLMEVSAKMIPLAAFGEDYHDGSFKGETINLKYNAYQSDLMEVEVMNHGWSVRRW